MVLWSIRGGLWQVQATIELFHSIAKALWGVSAIWAVINEPQVFLDTEY